MEARHLQGSRVFVLVFALGIGCAGTALVIRAKIVDRLRKAGRVTVVASPAEAEAVLTGVAVMTEALDYGASHKTSTLAEDEWRMNRTPVVAAILVGPTRQVLWQGEAAPRWLGPSSQVSDVVGQIAGGLVRAHRPDGGGGENSKVLRPGDVRSIAVGRLKGDEIGRLQRSRRVLVFDASSGADATSTGFAEAVSVYTPGSSSDGIAEGIPYFW